MTPVHTHTNTPRYRIVEIFESLQGKGCHTGMKAVFLRPGKCSPARAWCGTDYLKFEMPGLKEISGRLKTAGLSVCGIKLWETPTSCAEYGV